MLLEASGGHRRGGMLQIPSLGVPAGPLLLAASSPGHSPPTPAILGLGARVCVSGRCFGWPRNSSWLPGRAALASWRPRGLRAGVWGTHP